MTAPLGHGPEFEQAVSMARLEVKLDNLTSTVGEHGRDLKELKDRRFPLQTLAVLFAGAGGVCGLVAIVRPH